MRALPSSRDAVTRGGEGEGVMRGDNNHRAEPLTDAGGLGAGPGEVWQTETGGGTLQ